MKTAQTRQKNYADRRCRALSLQVGELVYLKVAPFKGARRFQVKGGLTLATSAHSRSLKGLGEVAYKLDVPSSLSSGHNVFHVSQLKSCL
jgi:hypothetical protein